MKIIFCSLLWLLSGFMHGQISDSIKIPEHNLFTAVEKSLWQNPVQQDGFAVQDYTAVTLDYGYKDLGVKRTQAAENISDAGFRTEGLYHYTQKLKLFGSFDYDFVTEKNLGFNLSNRRTEDDFLLYPNYLFVPKKADWENQNYRVKGGATYNLGHFVLGATADYRNQGSFRKSDPRPKITTADYTGQIFTGYNLGSYQLSVFAGLGRTTETYDILAVNEYINAPANPDYFVRFSNGYGRVVNFPSFSDFLYKTNLRRFGGGYRFQNTKIYLSAGYAFTDTMQNIYTKTVQNQVYIDPSLEMMKYRERQHQVFGTAVFSLSEAKIFSDFGADFITGDNFNNNEQGQNFRKNSDRYFLNLNFIKQKKDGKTYGMALETEARNFRAIDLLGVTDKKVQTLDVNLKYNRDLYRNGAASLNAELGIGRYFPLQSALDFRQVTSSNAFYQNVILPDYYFDSTPKTRASLNIYFGNKFVKHTSWKIFSKFDAVFAQKNAKVPTHFYQRPNLIIQSGVTFYY